jgi:hypothetical protein
LGLCSLHHLLQSVVLRLGQGDYTLDSIERGLIFIAPDGWLYFAGALWHT